MNHVLSRNSYDTRSVERRRLVGIAVAIVVLAGLWQVVRGPLIRTNASSSVGCWWRADLVRGGLREAGYAVSNNSRLSMHCLPRPGWIEWSVLQGDPVRLNPIRLSGLPPSRRQNHTVVDGQFQLIGRFATTNDTFRRTFSSFNSPPMDIDRDGRWELRVTLSRYYQNGVQSREHWAVLRMGPIGNELIWLGLVDDSKWRSKRTRIKPIWQDTDGDGTHELVFITVATTRTPSGALVFKTPVIIAEFALDRVGGILHTRSLTDGCGITPWNPPNDTPVLIDQTAKLGEIFVELLPPPSN